MDSLFFPQLLSGALAQYPIEKTRVVPSIKNVLPDGNMVLATGLNSNPRASRLVWQLSYSELSTADMTSLKEHFNACNGPFRGFTFIDPTENMLVSSGDLTAKVWQSGAIQISSGVEDPQGGNQGFVLTNISQASQQIAQTLTVPANYQYCFSAYVKCAQQETITLLRSGTKASNSTVLPVTSNWTRLISAGRLNDPGNHFTGGIVLMPGQQVTAYGIQLEAQLQPSRFRVTGKVGGVYPSAHWGVQEFAIVAEAPNLFSTSFSIETNL